MPARHSGVQNGEPRGAQPSTHDHPAEFKPPKRTPKSAGPTRKIEIPIGETHVSLNISGKTVELTNLKKLFWPLEGITKRDLLRYYADISKVLLPHIQNRAIVMKRYPNGAAGDFFFQKRAPEPHPDWLPICEILHPSANRVNFPVINDVADLLWVVNLG